MPKDFFMYLGTEDGLRVYQFNQDLTAEEAGRGLSGQSVRGIAVHPFNKRIAYIACGLRGWGLYKTTDSGKTVQSLGFEDKWVWDVVIDPHNKEHIYIGTEPPMVYHSRDAGRTFTPFKGIDQLPSKKRWKFFHPPFYGGHVHGISIHPHDPNILLAGVEHGALIYSLDGGSTWKEHLVGYDLHRTAINPYQPEQWFAGAGEGLYMSLDNGRDWIQVKDLKGKYVHSLLFDHHVKGRMFVFVDEPGQPIYRSDNFGKNWKPSSGSGLPSAGPADNIAMHPFDEDIVFYAGDIGNTSTLFVSEDGGRTWKEIISNIPKTWRVKVAG
ncbi:MAG: hypothetical protein H0Z32_10560 [Bacillaceae bacterium]|nr:hypothetical protein [Bacillaceae bacterium]